MDSPYRYIGHSSAGVKVVRTDLILLDALSKCHAPVTTRGLIAIADPQGTAQLTTGDAIRLLTFMVADGHVARDEHDGDPFASSHLQWSITERGRAHLVACEAQQIFDECARHNLPVRPDKLHIQEAPEQTPAPEADSSLNEKLRASIAALDEKTPLQVSVCNAKEPGDDDGAPSSALISVNEEELDEWWDNLDVEAKADAWSQWSLGNHGRNSHVYIEDEKSVPVYGTVGETPEQWRALRDRFTESKTAVGR